MADYYCHRCSPLKGQKGLVYAQQRNHNHYGECKKSRRMA